MVNANQPSASETWYAVVTADGVSIDEPLRTTRHEAVELYLDGTDVDEWPVEVTVASFTRANSRETQLHPLDYCLERLDELYGDAEGGEHEYEPIGALKEAERLFLEAVHSHYTPWLCSQTPGSHHAINTAEWVREHAAYWLETNPAIAKLVERQRTPVPAGAADKPPLGHNQD